MMRTGALIWIVVPSVIAHILIDSAIEVTKSYNRGPERVLFAEFRNEQNDLKLSPARPQAIVDKLYITFLLAVRNGVKSRLGAVCSRTLLTTMKAQQAVAIRFVGRRVIDFDVPFFYPLLPRSRPRPPTQMPGEQ